MFCDTAEGPIQGSAEGKNHANLDFYICQNFKKEYKIRLFQTKNEEFNGRLIHTK